MTRFRLHDRDLAAGIQAALSEGDRTGPVHVADVQAVLSMLEEEWAAGRHVDLKIEQLTRLIRPTDRNG